MIFRQLIDYTSNTYTYLLASGHSQKAILIDPVLERVDQYLTLLKELNLKLIYAADTHIHADHITATGQLREKTGCDILMGEKSLAPCVTQKIADGESFGFDEIQLKALFTPGHTDNSYSFVMKDRVFTGDVLLIHSTGRTDFQSGNPYDSYESLFHKLFKLPDETLVYPAHDYNGATVSTIGEEKKYNPRLQVKNAEEYVEIMNNLNLPKPALIDIAVPANMACGLNLAPRT